MTLILSAWAFLKRIPWQVWAALAAALALYLVYSAGHRAGESEVRAEWAEAAQEADKVEDESEGEAAQERENDTTEIEAAQEARDNAIENAGGTDRPSASAIALNCERLRRAGTDVSQLPTCSGRAGGAEANAGD